MKYIYTVLEIGIRGSISLIRSYEAHDEALEDVRMWEKERKTMSTFDQGVTRRIVSTPLQPKYVEPTIEVTGNKLPFLDSHLQEDMWNKEADEKYGPVGYTCEGC